MAVTQSNEKDRFVTQEESDAWNAMRESGEADQFGNRKVQDSEGNISETKGIVSGDVAAYQDKQVDEKGVDTYNERYGTDLTVDETTKKIERSQGAESEDVMRVDAPTDTTSTDTTTPTDTTTEKQPITDIAQFKAAGGTIEDLQNLIETRYGVSANIKDGAVMAEVNGELLEWQIDKGGQPRKISQGRVDDKYSVFARENGIKTQKVNGQTYFEPQSMEEAIDLYNQFGGRVPLTKKSIETIKASKSYEYFSQYKGASSDVIFEGMKSGQIGTGGETWEMLSKMNGGQPTLEMIDAQKKFEEYTKLSNVNGENKVIFDIVSGKDVTLQSASEKISTQIATRDAEYQTAIDNVYKSVDMSYSEFKNQNQDLSRLNNEVNDIASDIDELNTEKRKVWDEIEKEFPGITRSSAIDIYNQRVDAIDDQLYVLQRDFNNKSSSLNYQESLAKSEYEFKLQKAENQYQLITDMYNIEKGELVDQRAIARADEQLKEERAYLEEQRKQAIIDGDEARAKELTYQTELLEEKYKLQQKFTDYQFTTPSSGVIAKMNPSTGEIEFIEAPSTTTGGADITSKNTGDLRGLAGQFPGQAWAKNNNPAGITWNANFDNPTPGSTAQRLIDAGINFSKGTSRPASEGGNYVTFDTIEDGLAAQRIMMSGTYGDSTVGSMLQSWVGTSEGPSYAKQVAGNAGIDLGVKVSDLSDMELQQLQLSKIQKESPGLYDLLTETTEGVTDESGLTGDQIATAAGITIEVFGSRASDGERETIEYIMKSNPTWDRSQVLNAVKGFTFNNDEDREFGNSLLQSALVNQGGLQDIDLAGLARMINSGNREGAITKVENQIMSNGFEEGLISSGYREDSVRTAIRRTREIEDIISKMETDFGPIDGTIEQWKGNFKSNEATTLANKLITLSAQTKNALIGGSMTGGEVDWIDPLLPKISDKKEAIIQKTINLREIPFGEFNDARETLGLGRLTEDEILDSSLRVNSYNQKIGSQVTTQTQTTSTFDKLKQGTQGSSNDYESLIP